MSNGDNNIDQLSERDEDFFNEIEGEDAQLRYLNSINLYQLGPFPISNMAFQQKMESSQENVDLNSLSNQQSGIGMQERIHKNNIIFDDMKESTTIATSIMNNVLKKMEQEIYSRYINNNLNSFSIVRTIQYSQTIAMMGIQEADDEFDQNALIQNREDIEPELPVKEAWIRNHADIEQVQVKIPIVEERNSKLDYLGGPGGGGTTRSSAMFSPSPRASNVNFYKFQNKQPKKSKQLEKQLSPPKYEPINLEQETEYDQYEEIYRKMKMDEQKRKEQKEEQDKIQKQEQQKVRSELKKELKSKFTYDFDGRVITQKGVKTEKLPPSHHIMHFNMKEQEQPLMKKGFQKEVPQQVEQSKYAQQNKNQQQSQQNTQSLGDLRKSIPQGLDNQLQKLIPSTKMPYNEFTPQNGVTLFYNQQIKEGPKTQETITTFEDFEQKLKLLQPKEPMQITRSEYQRLTEKGNLVQNFKKTPMGQTTNNILKDLDGSQQTMFKTQFGKIYEEPPSSQFSQSNIFGRKSHSQFHFKKESFPSNVKVNNNKLTKHLVVDQQDEQNYEKKMRENIKKENSSRNQYNTNNGNRNKQQTPNDDFNLRLIQQPDWGKQKAGAYFPQIPKTSKQNKKIMQQTLSTLYKLPRERYSGQGFKLSKVLGANRKNKALSQQQQQQLEEQQLLETPYEFRGTFNSTHSKFTDTLRNTTYM